MFYSFEEIRKIADIVRDIDLRILMQYHSYPKDPQDNVKWHTPQGVISVNKQKFMNWTLGDGGGGAIDLAIHLQGFEYKDAVLWLYNNFSSTAVHQSSSKKSHYKKQNLKLPQRDDRNLFKVIHYLRSERCLPQKLINSLIESGKLYADAKANAVFLLLGKKKKVAGAELRGTCDIQWRGMAPGSKKDMGCFYITGVSTKRMILCESAIDAASCSVIYPEYTAISTSGVTANPAWLKTFITKGCSVYCGFDSDKTGNMLADKMLKLYPSIKRLRPANKHDWNDVIKEYHT
jgi:hypothetical protein